MSSETKLTLYSYFRSSCSWRVRIALALKGLDYVYEAVPLLQNKQSAPEYKELNAMEQIPTLIIENEAKGIKVNLTQSLAIAEFLDTLVSTPETLVFSADPLEKAQQMAIALDIASGIQPVQNLCVLKRVHEITNKDDAAKKAWAQHFIATGLSALEAKISKTYTGTFSYGDKVSFIDMCLIPQLYNARRFDVDVAQFPTLLKIEEYCEKLPYFIAAHPDQQPDAGKI